jgi:hypothetical protein
MQIEMFDTRFIRSRSKDPATSKEAAAKVEDFSAAMYQKISAELDKGNGTYEELADRMGAGKDQLCKRLPEMERLGIIQLTGELRKGSTGRNQRVWEKA